MSEMTKSEVRNLREQLNKVLQQNGLDGYEFQVGNATFSASEATFKLKVLKEGGVSHERKLLEREATYLKLDLEKVSNGWKLHEYHPRKRKFPFIVKHVDSDRMQKWPSSEVVKVFNQ